MNHVSTREITQAIQHFRHIASYLSIPKNQTENDTLIELARQLKIYSKKNVAAKGLLNLVLDRIETYEKNISTLKENTPAEVLAFLMEQHHLTQKDLPEIGSQSHVSKILSGKRQLTRQQISALSRRFNVSPSVWYG